MDTLKGLQAWSCANLMNMWRDPKSDMITPKALLGIEEEEPVPITSKEQLAELAAKARARARMEDV